MRNTISLLALASWFLAPLNASPVDYGPVTHWSADQLKTGHAPELPLQTPTHRFIVVRRTASQPGRAESHEGGSDVFFVVAGAGRVIAGGSIDKPAPLPDRPGEIRGASISGGRSYELKPGALINLPPATPYQFEPDAAGLTMLRLTINVGMHPWPIIQTQQTTLATANPNRPPVTVATSLGQGEVVFWSPDTLLRAHTAMVEAAASGKPTSDPRDLIDIPMTRTHAWNFLHRRLGANGQPPAVEFHEGTYDIYFIVAGTGTVMTGGTIQGRRDVAGRPGEEQGTLIADGTPMRVSAGDVINMPPSTPHQSIPGAAGFSYMLVKINTGTYPWSLMADEPPQ